MRLTKDVPERVARKAMDVVQERLRRYDELVGVGVVPKQPRSREMVVAVYVSKPEETLSAAFRRSVPACVDVVEHGRRSHVGTKIVNVGHLAP